MAWKVILEVILGIISILIGYVFWSSVKAPKFLGQILSNYRELLKFVTLIGKATFVGALEFYDVMMDNTGYTEKMKKNNIGYDLLIPLRLSALIKAFDRMRNIFFLLFIGVVIVSYFIGIIYILINIFLFLITGLLQMSSAAQNQVLDELKIIILTFYKWNINEPDKCQQYCTQKYPRYENIYRSCLNF